MRKYSLYFFFSLSSIFMNVGAQSIVFAIISREQLDMLVAIFFGTAISFIFKYYMDKKYVFKAKKSTKKKENQRIFLYTLFSVFTTLLYIGTEMAAHYFLSENFFFGAKEEFGATVGLIAGYIIKYHLDNNITFKEEK